jgi:hypothetical protein
VKTAHQGAHFDPVEVAMLAPRRREEAA